MFEVDVSALRRMIFAKKFSASKVAKLAGLTVKTVAKLFKDGATANAQTIGKLAAALDCDGETLILKEM